MESGAVVSVMRTAFLRRPKSVAVVGLGNIGSQFVPYLARWGLERVVLIDRDVYESKNLISQQISAEEVGKPKAKTQAERLKRLNPGVVVEPLVCDLDAVPLGKLHVDLIVSCVDSLEARIRLNECAWRLGVGWLDAGVETEVGLARVTAYLPGRLRPCVECMLTDEDYISLGSRTPCMPTNFAGAPTNGLLSLGGLAAAMLAIECEKVLTGNTHGIHWGRQILYDTRCHRHYVSKLVFNPNCRFDHMVWRVKLISVPNVQVSLGWVLARIRRAVKAFGRTPVRLACQVFTKALHCPHCGFVRERFYVLSRVPLQWKRCPNCGGRDMSAVGLKIVDVLEGGLSKETLATPVNKMGIQLGDIFATEAGGKTVACELVGGSERRFAKLRNARSIRCEAR